MTPNRIAKGVIFIFTQRARKNLNWTYKDLNQLRLYKTVTLC